MLDRFRRRLGSPPPRRILIGLSGGSDSVALLALALDWRTAHDPKVEIATAHLDHGLRGERAGEDAEFCRTLAASVGVSHYESAVDVARRAREERDEERLDPGPLPIEGYSLPLPKTHHRSYAAQWFAIAALALALWLWASLRLRPAESPAT